MCAGGCLGRPKPQSEAVGSATLFLRPVRRASGAEPMRLIENIYHRGRWRTRDARGQSRSLYSPIGDSSDSLGGALARPQLDSIIHAATGKSHSRLQWYQWALIVNACVLGVYVLARYILSPDFDRFLTLWIPACIAIHLILFRHKFMRCSPETFTRVLLLHYRCPHCGYPLDPHSREQDGCTVCSECGSAWTLKEVA